MSNIDQVITTGLYIDGETRPAGDGAVYDIHNPARPEVLVGQAAAATEKDVDDAVRAAHAAFPAWAARSFEERANNLDWKNESKHRSFGGVRLERFVCESCQHVELFQVDRFAHLKEE